MTTKNSNLSGIKVYVGSDGKLHFKDGTGADSVIPFSTNKDPQVLYPPSNANNTYGGNNGSTTVQLSAIPNNKTVYISISVYHGNSFFNSFSFSNGAATCIRWDGYSKGSNKLSSCLYKLTNVTSTSITISVNGDSSSAIITAIVYTL